LPREQAWAVGLLRRTSAYRPPSGRKQRVRMGLAQDHRRRGRGLLLRPAIAVLVLVGFGAVASAALGRWPNLVADAYHRLIGVSPTRAPEAARAVPVRPALARAGRSGNAAGAPGAASAQADSIVPVPSAGLAEAPPVVVQMAAPPPARGSRRATMSEPVRKLAPAAVREPGAATRAGHATALMSADDTGPVIQAMRALRVEGNPVRARALLSRYLVRYPQGTLAEEALAMSIEAANVHRDGDAAVLAKRYLRLYPAGHFASLARQTLAGASAPAGN